MDLTKMSPAEIDQVWLEAVAPANAVAAQADAKRRTAKKYGDHGGYADQAKRYDAEADTLYARANEMRAKVEAPYLAEWARRGGWTRAYLVLDGHIHRSTACSTLYPTTLISWLPEQSGLSEDEIVKLAGVNACTVCYPSAPVDALRAAEAAAKAEGECPGSRTYDYEEGSWKQTSYTGSGRAKCRHCGEYVGTSKTHKLRAHKRAEVTA